MYSLYIMVTMKNIEYDTKLRFGRKRSIQAIYHTKIQYINQTKAIFNKLKSLIF